MKHISSGSKIRLESNALLCCCYMQVVQITYTVQVIGLGWAERSRMSKIRSCPYGRGSRTVIASGVFCFCLILVGSVLKLLSFVRVLEFVTINFILSLLNFGRLFNNYLIIFISSNTLLDINVVSVLIPVNNYFQYCSMRGVSAIQTVCTFAGLSYVGFHSHIAQERLSPLIILYFKLFCGLNASESI